MNDGDKIAEEDIAAYDMSGVAAYAPETRSDIEGIPRHLLTAAVLNGEVWFAAELGGTVENVLTLAKALQKSVIYNAGNVPFVQAEFLAAIFDGLEMPEVVDAIQDAKANLLAHHATQLN